MDPLFPFEYSVPVELDGEVFKPDEPKPEPIRKLPYGNNPYGSHGSVKLAGGEKAKYNQFSI